ncbi:MAG TPA: DUF4932 domain-containing protein [Phycisphaerales bacterium]|nr:DUF4932 domain-containing protein [Phycisphaerales bacterium]
MNEPRDELIPVRVSTRVELLSIVFQLAGAPEYNQYNAKSPYAQRSLAYFRDFAGHEAVKLARRYRKDHGVSHDAVMSLAVHLAEPKPGEPLLPLKPKILFDFKPERLEKRWNAERANAFLEALNRFAVDAKVEAFFAEHAGLYEKTASRLSERVNARPYRAWLDGFFGAKPGATFMAMPGLMNGGQNYGVSVLHADGREEVLPVIGVHRFDADGVPVFAEADGPVIVHEFCHAYVNPLVDKHAKDLVPAFEKLFSLRSPMMRQQAYGNAQTVAYETLVRACTVRYAVEKESKEAAEAQLLEERGRGFLWVGELVELMGRFQLQREKYPTFESFMPEVVEHCTNVAGEAAEQMKKLPAVKSVTPDVRGSAGRNVDPAAKEIVIEFDRPMRGSVSLVGDPKALPRLTGSPWWSSDGRTCTLPVRLEPGRRYTLKLNGPGYRGFCSADGYAMDPVEWSFSTTSK